MYKGSIDKRRNRIFGNSVCRLFVFPVYGDVGIRIPSEPEVSSIALENINLANECYYLEWDLKKSHITSLAMIAFVGDPPPNRKEGFFPPGQECPPSSVTQSFTVTPSLHS